MVSALYNQQHEQQQLYQALINMTPDSLLLKSDCSLLQLHYQIWWSPVCLDGLQVSPRSRRGRPSRGCKVLC